MQFVIYVPQGFREEGNVSTLQMLLELQNNTSSIFVHYTFAFVPSGEYNLQVRSSFRNAEMCLQRDNAIVYPKTRRGLESFAICTIYEIIYPQTPYCHTGLSSLAEEHLWDRHLGSTKEHLSYRVGFSSIQSLPSSIQSPCGCLMQQREGVAPMLP